MGRHDPCAWHRAQWGSRGLVKRHRLPRGPDSLLSVAQAVATDYVPVTKKSVDTGPVCF